MAVPSSGAISLARIRGELQSSNYSLYTAAATSLGSASNGTYGAINTYNASADRPDGNTPHAMSEFYAYDHDYNPAPDFSATVTVGTDTLYSSAAYGYGNSINYFPAMGSINNTSFNSGTIMAIYWHNNGNVFFEFSFSKPSFSSLTIGSTTFPGSSSWTSSTSEIWKYATSSNPFGTTNNASVSVTANY